MQALGLHLETIKKWLGIDYQPAALKPVQPTRASRLRQAKKNWTKTKLHHRKFGRGGTVVRQGHCSSLGYGASCMGSAEAVASYVKARTRATQAGAGAFRSGSLGAALSKCQEWAKLLLAPVKAWVAELWENTARCSTMSKAWNKQVQKLQKIADTAGPTAAWQYVKGPVGATWAAIAEMQGSMSSYNQVTVAGETVGLEGNYPQDVMARLGDIQQSQALNVWAQRPGREMLLPRPWMAPAQHLLSRKLSKRWTKKHRNTVRMAVTGGFPEQQDLFEKGRADSPLCPLCREEKGTLQHFYWRCQHVACVKARKQLAPLTKQEEGPNFSSWVHRGATAKEEPRKWTRV